MYKFEEKKQVHVNVKNIQKLVKKVLNKLNHHKIRWN